MTLRQALLRGRRRPRRSAEGSPLHYRSDGYEFVELREYVHGDDVRRIDWAASARSAQLQTRVLLEDVALTLGVYLDTTPSMRVGRRKPLADAAHAIRDEWFAAAAPTDRTRVFDALDEAVALPRGAALLAITDTFGFDAARGSDLLAQLGHRCDCTALIARDPWQDALPLSGFVRMRDAETGDAQLLFIGAAQRRRYRAASLEREAALLELLARLNWRTGVFSEGEGAPALLRAFGV
ncbi:MAG: DUF58 domain-containing protein [Candidatus Baltobacteraceae bacterium]